MHTTFTNPKPLTIDLHTHVRGTLLPNQAKYFSEKNGAFIPSAYFNSNGEYHFNGFEEFLSVYDKIGAVIKTEEDLEKLTTEYLLRCGHQGTRYIELMISPDHSVENGISVKAQFDAIARGLKNARTTLDIDASVIATAVRHKGHEVALALAEHLYELDHPIVKGFGLTGNESVGDIEDFAGAFYVAKTAGLGLTAHVGEWTCAKNILTAVDALNLDRIGHGISAVEDKAVLDVLSQRQIGIEVCPSSNIYLKRYACMAEHPIIEMMDAGCKVTIATDDPAYFNTTPLSEYRKVQETFKRSNDQMKQISRNAIDVSFCSTEIKEKLRSYLTAS